MKRFLILVLTTLLAVQFSGCSSWPWGPFSDAEKNRVSGGNAQAGEHKAVDQEESNLEKSLQVDVTSLRANDGQPLLVPPENKEIPHRPSYPESLPLTDPLRWFDAEYAGWKTEKLNIPESPADGAIGKKIIMIITADHPYWTGVGIGAKKVADAYGMKFKMLCPHSDINKQNRLIESAIREKPDMILFASLDAKAAVSQLGRINQAGIPVIAFNTIPDSEALKYCIAWSGPDDWGQFRLLARTLADKLDKRGGIAFLRHLEGGSPYFSRTYGPISELVSYAPDIKTLDMQAPGFNMEKSRDTVKSWISTYGHSLNAIVCGEDSYQVRGAVEAVKATGREDIVIVASGNSKISMEAVKAGELFAITYQSAEGDGAMPVKLAADWFNGQAVPPIAYLSKHIITKEDVDKYMPAQF